MSACVCRCNLHPDQEGDLGKHLLTVLSPARELRGAGRLSGPGEVFACSSRPVDGPNVTPIARVALSVERGHGIAIPGQKRSHSSHTGVN